MRHPTGAPPITSESEVVRDAELEHLTIEELYRRLDRLMASQRLRAKRSKP